MRAAGRRLTLADCGGFWMPLKAIIFDVDGTIAETEEAHRQAFNAAFGEFGFPVSWDVPTYGRLLKVAGSRERMRHYFSHDAPQHLQRFEAVVDALFADKTGKYGALVRRGDIALRPGIRRLIADARTAGVKLALATTSGRGNVVTLLEHSIGKDAPFWFSAMATGDMVTAKKPDPELYLMALDGLGLPAGHCIAIEDSEIGIAAARAAGLAVVMAPSSYTMEDPVDGAIAAVDHLGDPGRPATALSDAAPAGEYVTLDDLRRWNAAANATLP